MSSSSSTTTTTIAVIYSLVLIICVFVCLIQVTHGIDVNISDRVQQQNNHKELVQTPDSRIRLAKDEVNNPDECTYQTAIHLMTVCWIQSLNKWQLNVTGVEFSGAINSTCGTTDRYECDLRFCCATIDVKACAQDLAQYVCAKDLAAGQTIIDQSISYICPKQMPPKACHSVESLDWFKSQNSTADGHQHHQQDMDDQHKHQGIVKTVGANRMQRISIYLAFNSAFSSSCVSTLFFFIVTFSFAIAFIITY